MPVLLTCPSPEPMAQVHVSLLHTGDVPSDWRKVVDDGTTGAVDLPVMVGIIEHPDATIAVDAGLGLLNRSGDQPGWPLSGFALNVPDGAALIEQRPEQPDLFLMTHLHYDHIGGLFDYASPVVWAPEAELRTYLAGAPGFPRRKLSHVAWRSVRFGGGEAGQVLGRSAVDVMGDGTVWYVDLPGHSPGAAGVLVAADDGPWLFLGDTAWVDQHLHGANRPLRVSMLVDANRRDLSHSLDWARQVAAACPELRVVAGHEPSLIGAP